MTNKLNGERRWDKGLLLNIGLALATLGAGVVLRGARAADTPPVVQGVDDIADAAPGARPALPCGGLVTPAGKVPGLAAPLAQNPCLPHGFQSAAEFDAFGRDLYAGLEQAGYDDAQALMQGSAVTGRSHSTGEPFDLGRRSDFDVGLISEEAFLRALDDPRLQAYYKTVPERIGPIKAGTPEAQALGLDQLLTELSRKANRSVEIMLYASPQEAYTYQRSLPIIYPDAP